MHKKKKILGIILGDWELIYYIFKNKLYTEMKVILG